MDIRYALIFAGLVVVVSAYTAHVGAEEPVAILQQSNGDIFVNRDQRMVAGESGMPLYSGNRVVVVTGGSTTITYADGCKVILKENSVLVVNGTGQCATGQAIPRTADVLHLPVELHALQRVATTIDTANNANGINKVVAVADKIADSANNEQDQRSVSPQ